MSEMQVRERGAYQALFEGAVREDFTATDFALLIHAASSAAARMETHGPELASRHIELLIKGIAATPDPTPVPAPLADDDFQAWMRAAYSP
ncbi:hypothetical protein ACFZDK_42830 [Streptomyces sp. NPDC007901]|uniref:hypothetical protein n=1 Tax=Streptomyces sp. NPDC007901 TaxID=3364785 RepID=UPI0036EB4B36